MTVKQKTRNFSSRSYGGGVYSVIAVPVNGPRDYAIVSLCLSVNKLTAKVVDGLDSLLDLRVDRIWIKDAITFSAIP